MTKNETDGVRGNVRNEELIHRSDRKDRRSRLKEDELDVAMEEMRVSTEERT